MPGMNRLVALIAQHSKALTPSLATGLATLAWAYLLHNGKHSGHVITAVELDLILGAFGLPGISAYLAPKNRDRAPKKKDTRTQVEKVRDLGRKQAQKHAKRREAKKVVRLDPTDISAIGAAILAATLTEPGDHAKRDQRPTRG